ncbi:MAG: MBG domain-containing protein [Bacteroidota bacterium]
MSISLALPQETEYTGNLAVAGYYDDEVWGAFPIGFNFDFFGNTYTDFFVNSNGLVMFGAGGPHFNNREIPNPGGINNFIAPFWDDIVIHSSGDIMYQTIGTAPNRKLVIQFYNMSFWNSPVLLGSFHVILYESSNNIQVQYRTIVEESSDLASGGSATIGLEDAEGKSGVLCSYNTPGFVKGDKAIMFTPVDGSYTFDEHAVYEGIFLQPAVPRAGTPILLSPANQSSVSDYVTFKWNAAANASSYYVVISQNPDLSNPIHTSADLVELFYEYPLSTDQTYYWSVYAKNSTDAVSWSEIWSFQTKSSAPLIAVPQTAFLEQGDQRILTLMFTGGDAGSKTATINTLPAEGDLYQYSEGLPGPRILTVPALISDPSFKLIYSASGASGTGVGSFEFEFSDLTWNSTAEIYTIHVSPPGIPNFLYASKETDRVEITFDRSMADPGGKHLEFSIQDDGVDVSSISCELKQGDPATIVVYVSPALNTDHAISVSYTKGSVAAETNGLLESFDFQLAGKLAQVINFSELADKSYGDPDFSLSATASSGLPVSYSSSNSTVVSVSGSSAAINNAGETLIYASQEGDSIYAPVIYERHQLVNKVPATITLSDLNQEYTGSGIQVTVTTLPEGLNYKVSYNGSITLPMEPGTYEVSAIIADPNYYGSATGTLAIHDFGAPVPDLDVLPDLADECSVTPTPPTATDQISGIVTGTTNTPIPITNQGTTLITWTYVDEQGNSSSQTQTVILDDVTVPETPVLPDVTGECSLTAPIPTTTDACAGKVTGTTADPLTYTSQGIHVINWNFDDGNGNSIDVTQNMIISDLTAPTASCPEDVYTCNGTDLSIALDDVFDNCSVPLVTYVLSGASTGSGSGDASAEVFNPGETMVTYTLADAVGNSSQCMFTVTKEEIGEIVVSENAGTLTVETRGSYQWINCTDNAIIEGQTANSFTPGLNGEYAVIVTMGSCSDTSECYAVDYTDLDLNELAQRIQVYPNPADQFLNIDLEHENTNVTLKLVNTMGQPVLIDELEILDNIRLNMNSLNPGIYLLVIKSDQMDRIIRIVKE